MTNNKSKMKLMKNRHLLRLILSVLVVGATMSVLIFLSHGLNIGIPAAIFGNRSTKNIGLVLRITPRSLTPIGEQGEGIGKF